MTNKDNNIDLDVLKRRKTVPYIYKSAKAVQEAACYTVTHLHRLFGHEQATRCFILSLSKSRLEDPGPRLGSTPKTVFVLPLPLSRPSSRLHIVLSWQSTVDSRPGVPSLLVGYISGTGAGAITQESSSAPAHFILQEINSDQVCSFRNPVPSQLGSST